MADKQFKHLLMRISGFIHRPTYEKVRFLIKRGWWPDLERPSTINEWLVSQKLANSYKYPELSGKLEAYAYARTCIPDILIPNVVAVLDETSSAFPRDLLPGKYFLKGSRGSGMICPVTIYQSDVCQSQLTQLDKIIKTWLSTSYEKISGEKLYESAKNCILLETSLTTDGQPAPDIKIHCSSGVPRVLQYINRSSGSMVRFTWRVESESKLVPVRYYVDELKDPPNDITSDLLLSCVRAAKSLCQGLTYVRVDFMVVNKKPIFSELTFCPAGGCMPLLTRSIDHIFFLNCFENSTN